MSPPKPSFAAPFDDASLQAFCDLLALRTGLQVRDKDRAGVARTLAMRCEALRLKPGPYLQKLRLERVEEAEWTHLMPLLTNGESYFERDKGQFALIRDTILPELIERRGRAGETNLRLWSAGCSSGEEVYSLAMATAAVLPPQWKATILGTDINPEALRKARRGVYGAWSFRGVEPATRNRYFRAVGSDFEVVSELRSRVTFGFCNLSAPDWPDPARGIAEMDLIVCRNVLIYFQRPVVAGVLSRFARTLREGGFLLTGHAELHDQNVSPLRARLFPTSAAYQKDLGCISNSPAPLTAAPRPLSSDIASKPVARTLLPGPTPKSTSLPLITPRSSSPSPSPQPVAPTAPHTAEQWCAQARRLADSGRYDEAIACCRSAISASPAHAEAYFVWAHIAEEQGQHGEAKDLLKKVIYLAPSHAEAYVQLAAIYEREGDAVRARQMRASALRVLQSPGPVDSGSTTSATNHEELLRHLQTLLGETDSAPATRPGERR